MMALMQSNKIQRALVLCPPQLVQNWKKESHKLLPAFTGLRNKIILVLLDSRTAPKERTKLLKAAQKKARDDGCKLLVFASENLIKVSDPKDRQKSAMFPAESEAWDWVVLDEVCCSTLMRWNLLNVLLRFSRMTDSKVFALFKCYRPMARKTPIPTFTSPSDTRPCAETKHSASH